jgi:hypothetical protein
MESLMRSHLSFAIACVWALLAHLWVTPAHAQETDGRFLIGLGIVQTPVTHTTMKVDGRPAQSSTLLQSPLGGQALFTAGFGLGSWVFAIEARLVRSTASVDIEYDYEYRESQIKQVARRTEVRLGPSARYLFGDGVVRPFIEAGAGLGVRISSVDSGMRSQGDTLYARGGPGAQLRLSDSSSLEVALQVGYATTPGELEPVVGSRLNPVTGLYSPIYPGSAIDYTVQQITADVAVRLSVWL